MIMLIRKMLVRKKTSALLAIALVLIFATMSVAYADACKDKFVACVAETGSIPQCSSISRSCTLGNTGEQLDTSKLKVTPSLFDRGGKRWIQITIENPNIHQVKLSNHTETLTCADGSIFTAHLYFEGDILQGEEKIHSHPQIVCLGADFAENTKGTEGRKHIARAGHQYACNPNQAEAPVYNLHAIKGGNIKAVSGSIHIIYDLAAGTAQGLFEALCGAEDINSKQNGDEAGIVKLQNLLDKIITKPEYAPSKPTKTAPTGPRG